MSKPHLRKSENSPWFLTRYCGINFGLLRSVGYPSSSVDYLCMLHDRGYEQLIQDGQWKSAYLEWNQYDDAFVQGLTELMNNKIPKQLHEHVVIHVANALFHLKKAVLKHSDYLKSPEELPKSYLNKPHFLEYIVNKDGTIDVENTAHENDFITPDRPPKRLPHSISPRHPDLASLLRAREQEDDEDLLLAVNLSRSFTNLPGDPQEVDTGGNDMSSGQLDATPVTKTEPTYGFPNTVTQILPWNATFSVFNCIESRIAAFDIRMTTPYDMFRSNCTFLANNDTQTTGNNVLYGHLLDTFTSTSTTAANVTTAGQRYFRANSSLNMTQNKTTDAPYMREYWENFYKYYTVLGCEWELTATNITQEAGADLMIGYLYTSRVKPPVNFVQSGQTTQFVTPRDALHWKGIKWHTVNSDKGLNGINNILTIKDTYRRGDMKSNLEIMNDDKREIWNPIQQLPQVPEDLTVIVMRSPSAYATDRAADVAGISGVRRALPTVNFLLRLKYIVQFKELQETKEYMTNTGFEWTQPISNYRNITTAVTTEEASIKNREKNYTNTAPSILNAAADAIDEVMGEQ